MSPFAKISAEEVPAHFIVGRDGADHWVVVETHGLAGGLFTDKATALRFAREESRGRQDAIEIADYRLDFRVGGH
ncbi:MAG: hypothetical protein ACLPID_05360 [Beijerinckiaceae bacterium]